MFSSTERPNQQSISEKREKKLEKNTAYWMASFLYELKIVCKILIVHSQKTKCIKPQWMMWQFLKNRLILHDRSKRHGLWCLVGNTSFWRQNSSRHNFRFKILGLFIFLVLFTKLLENLIQFHNYQFFFMSVFVVVVFHERPAQCCQIW